MPLPREMLRMSDAELDAFLERQRTLRCGTVSADRVPHVVPLWFIWYQGAIWLNSLRRSRRAHDLAQGSRVALCVDAGEDYRELRGAVLYGVAEDASSREGLQTVRSMFGAKYWEGVTVPDLRSHRWLAVVPDQIVSWDFAKIPTGQDERVEALEGR